MHDRPGAALEAVLAVDTPHGDDPIVLMALVMVALKG